MEGGREIEIEGGWKRRQQSEEEKEKESENNTKRWNGCKNSRCPFSTGYEWLLHILQLCNLREKERGGDRERQDRRVIKWEAICYFYASILSPSPSFPSSLLTSPLSFVCSAAQKFLNMIMRGCQRCPHTHTHTHACVRVHCRVRPIQAAK